MDQVERARIARVCRQQAVLASTLEAQNTLIELAEHYEKPAASAAVEPVEAPPEELE